MSVLSVATWDEVRGTIQEGWGSQIFPFFQHSGDRIAQSVVSSFSFISSSVSDLLNSVDHSSHLFRLVSNVSSLAKSLFGVAEANQVLKLNVTAEVLDVTRCFTFPNYILGGHFEDDCRKMEFWAIGSACLWAVADLSSSCLFFFPNLSKKKNFFLNEKMTLLGVVGMWSNALASGCDLARRVHNVFLERAVTPSEFLDIMGAGSDVLSSFLVLLRIRAKVALVALYVFSNLTSLLSRVLTKNR